MVKNSIKKGVGFGLTSGIITTLGLIIGLYSSTNSRLVILGGIFVIAIADALSDSLGMHISEETNKKNSKKEIWEATFSTFFSKFIFALTFIIPILFLEIKLAVIMSIIWGFLLISIFSYQIGKRQGDTPMKSVREHILIMIFVIVVTYYVGKFAGIYFA